MKVAIDTNVLVSAAIATHATCAQLLDLLLAGVLRPCADDRILAEYRRVLYRARLGLNPGEVAAVLGFIGSVAECVTGIPLAVELPHRTDAAFLEVAAATDALLVTGNIRHYPASCHCGVTVLTPRECLELVRRTP